MSNSKIYNQGQLIDGTKVEMLICKGIHVAVAQLRMTAHNLIEGNDKFDVTIFLIVELCLFNGEKKDLDYILNMDGADYVSIFTDLNDVLTKVS